MSGRCSLSNCVAGPFQCANPDACETVWYGGHANQLSTEKTAYPRIDGIHGATKLSNCACRGISAAEPAPTGSGEIKLPPPASSRRAFGEVARMRRSALDFLGGMQSMSLTQLSAILAAASRPFSADFAGDTFHPALSVRPSRRGAATRRVQALAGARRVGADQGVATSASRPRASASGRISLVTHAWLSR